MTPSGIMTPAAQSGVNTPFYAQSRAGSSENLAVMVDSAVTPAALSSRLQNVSLNSSHRNISFTSNGSHSGAATPYTHHQDGDHTAESSQPHSTDLSRRTSEEEHSGASGHSTPPEHLDFLDLEELSKVPSYTTATRAPLPRTPSFTGSLALPDYNTVMSAPNSPTRIVMNDPLATISEGSQIDSTATSVEGRSRSTSGSRRTSGLGFNYLHMTPGDNSHSERRVRLMQSRGGAS
jgi:hypothetical protein